jgi:hypothetical protein
MNSLDTEIRRAMGELANAAPPAREPESFRREFSVPRDPGSGNRGGASRWLLATAATMVVGLVGVVLVIATSDDPSATITTAPITTAPTVGLTGDALLDELSSRRWVALERFDDPSPTARTPEFAVTSSDGSASVEGFDGCNTYSGTFELDGATVESGEFTSTTDADTLLLSDLDGSPLARFHDLDQLTPATDDDMPYTFFVDDLESVGFGVSGVGFTRCTRVDWDDTDDGVKVTLLETDSCNVASSEGAASDWLADVTRNGADALLTPDGLLLASGDSTLQLRRLEEVEPDPNGVTLAAGAVFGFQPGNGTSVDDVLAALVPRFGEPDIDSGWIPAERSVHDGNVTVYAPCRELTEYRELWWGDLSFGFWATGSRSMLHFWKVGDPQIRPFLVPDVEVGSTTPTGLTTEDGVGVGAPATSIPDRFDVSDQEGFFGFDPSGEPEIVTVLSANPAYRSGGVAFATIGGLYVIVDGVVIGFGAETFTSC